MTVMRDDDVGITTKLSKFQFVHEIFQKFKVKHTLALITKDIEKNEELVNYLNKYRDEFDLQLHCYEHFDYSELDEGELRLQFTEGLRKFIKLDFDTPTIWYPSWNRTSDLSNQIAAEFNLIPKPGKVSIDQYIRFNGDVKEDTVNFHYWYEPEVNDLYRALKIYTSK